MSELNKFSRRVTQPKSQGASQAMMYGTGMTEESNPALRAEEVDFQW